MCFAYKVRGMGGDRPAVSEMRQNKVESDRPSGHNMEGAMPHSCQEEPSSPTFQDVVTPGTGHNPEPMDISPLMVGKLEVREPTEY